MRRLFTAYLIIGALGITLACSDDPQLQQGSEGGACFANNTCMAGLVCQAGTCARPSDGAPPTADGGIPDQQQTPDAALTPLTWTACDTSVWPAGYPKPASGVQCTFIEVPVDYKKRFPKSKKRG